MILVNVDKTNGTLFSEIVLSVSYHQYVLTIDNTGCYDKLITCFLPSVIFQIIAGTEIYRHFCSSSVYYFSRCCNRKRWFFKESLTLYFLTLQFYIVFLLSYTVMLSLICSVKIDDGSIILAVYYIIIFSLWNFAFSLLINVLSIFFKSHGGFSISIGIQLFFSMLYIAFESIIVKIYDGDAKAELILKAIPFSHLFIGWHSSTSGEINSIINILNMNFDLNFSVLVLFLFAVLTVIFGIIVIERTDFICSNKESGG